MVRPRLSLPKASIASGISCPDSPPKIFINWGRTQPKDASLPIVLHLAGDILVSVLNQIKADTATNISLSDLLHNLLLPSFEPSRSRRATVGRFLAPQMKEGRLPDLSNFGALFHDVYVAPGEGKESRRRGMVGAAVEVVKDVMIRESNNVINDQSLHIPASSATCKVFENLANDNLLLPYQQHSPITHELLFSTLNASTPYTKKKANRAKNALKNTALAAAEAASLKAPEISRSQAVGVQTREEEGGESESATARGCAEEEMLSEEVLGDALAGDEPRDQLGDGRTMLDSSEGEEEGGGTGEGIRVGGGGGLAAEEGVEDSGVKEDELDLMEEEAAVVFSFRDPVHIANSQIAQIAFARNRECNSFQLQFGLYCSLGGSSTRLTAFLSALALGPSYKTIERLLASLSDDADSLAVQALIKGYPILQDNINIFFRKEIERLRQEKSTKTNQVNATMAAVLPPPPEFNINMEEALDLTALWALRGKRSEATPAEIRPNGEDATILKSFGIHTIVQLFVAHGGANIGRKKQIRKELEDLGDALPGKPLPIVKSQCLPLKIFDRDEGKVKEFIELIEDMQKKTNLSKEEFSARTRLVLGDLGSIATLRGAALRRQDEEGAFDQLSYIVGVAQPLHFEFASCKSVCGSYTRTDIADPSSLDTARVNLKRSATGLNEKKPDFHRFEDLLSTVLTSRIFLAFRRYLHLPSHSALMQWLPKSLEEVVVLAEQFYEEYGTNSAVEQAQDASDDVQINNRLLIRDALLHFSHRWSVRSGNPDARLSLLKWMGTSFRGGPHAQYAAECVNHVLMFTHELPPALAYAANCFSYYNEFGLKNGWKGSDQKTEECINKIKNNHAAQGGSQSMEYLASHGSANIEVCTHARTALEKVLGLNARRSNPKVRRADADLAVLVSHGSLEELMALKPNRKIPAGPLVNRWQEGLDKLDSGGLVAFMRRTAFDEQDGSAMPSFSVNVDSNLGELEEVYFASEMVFGMEGEEDEEEDFAAETTS